MKSALVVGAFGGVVLYCVRASIVVFAVLGALGLALILIGLVAQRWERSREGESARVRGFVPAPVPKKGE